MVTEPKEPNGQPPVEADTPHQPATLSTHAGSRIPIIVGIGASAGGLEALQEFFKHMPADNGMAFVVVTHQPHDHVSLLPDLLRKHTTMPVQEVSAGVKVEPDHVYLSRPGILLSILGTNLQLMQRDTTHGVLQFPIDYFFRALADDQKDKAICIILSGTGTDGTLGLQAIKGLGGLTMAQEEHSARFSGMPDSAIATGLVDYVLPVAQMPDALLAFVQSPYVRSALAPTLARPLTADVLRQIYILLRNHTKHDFSAYKTNTLQRRIERRMNIQQVQTPQRYLDFLRKYPDELDVLLEELLIGVTNFFRDPDAFEVLATQAFPSLLARHPESQTFRGWVPGCSTGEEAYTLAILLHECMQRLDKQFPIQIFATDLSGSAIEKARTGLYPDGIGIDVSPERLKHFFVKAEAGYRINKNVRDMVIFARQDLLKDPPFIKLDLVSCRNLLIYLNAEMQKQLMPLFHYVLNPGGLLFLGSSETIGGFSELFTPLDKRWKVFQRKESVASRLPMELPLRHLNRYVSPPLVAALAKKPSSGLPALVDRLLLQRFAPPSLVVRETGDVVHIHGLTGLFLQPAPGPPNSNIFSMAREGLRTHLSTAVRRAAEQNTSVVHKEVQVKTNGDFTAVDLSVQKLTDPEPLQGLYLVTLQESAAEPGRSSRAKKGRARTHSQEQYTDQRVAELEREVQALHETLQSTVEGANTTNEELKSSNEELQAANEELQSSNEELETAKEEMQSLNEELQTVNSELQGKVEDLSQATDDMQNLLNGTQIATLFLDDKLRIKRFTTQATRVVKLIPSDVGRPIGDLVINLDYADLEADAREVLRTLLSKETQVSSLDGTWYLVRILPYRTAGNMIDGLVITCIDISSQMRAEAKNEAFLMESSAKTV